MEVYFKKKFKNKKDFKNLMKRYSVFISLIYLMYSFL